MSHEPGGIAVKDALKAVRISQMQSARGAINHLVGYVAAIGVLQPTCRVLKIAFGFACFLGEVPNLLVLSPRQQVAFFPNR
jgi:hypothetical protein